MSNTLRLPADRIPAKLNGKAAIPPPAPPPPAPPPPKSADKPAKAAKPAKEVKPQKPKIDRVEPWRRVLLAGTRLIDNVHPNGYLGVAHFHLPALGITVRECAVHRRGDGVNVQIPGRPRLDAAGQRVAKPDGRGWIYDEVLKFPDDIRAAFCAGAAAVFAIHHAALLAPPPDPADPPADPPVEPAPESVGPVVSPPPEDPVA